MKTKFLILLLITTPALLQAQGGSLTPPPGVPAPTMKSLDIVEARIPLVAGAPGVAIGGTGTITISQPGSYYLTGTRTYTASTTGILISSSDVTLDLNGYALINTTGSGTAILIQAGNVNVRNGLIRGGTTYNGTSFTEAGWQFGIQPDATYPNLLVQDISVTGTRDGGISLVGDGNRIVGCSVHTVGGYGLSASSVFHSSALKAQSTAILTPNGSDAGAVIGCHGESVSTENGIGIYAIGGAVSDSVGISVGGEGISARMIHNSRGISVDWVGLSATVVINSSGISTYSTGLSSVNAQNCYGSSSSGSAGMWVSGTANGCSGERPNGVAINAGIAIGCTALSGTISSPEKHLGTP